MIRLLPVSFLLFLCSSVWADEYPKMVYCKGGLSVNDKIHFGDTLVISYWLKNVGDTAFEGRIVTNMNTNWNDSVVLDTSATSVINPGDSVEVTQKYPTGTSHFLNGETTVIVIWPTGDGTKSSFPPLRLKELTLTDDPSGMAAKNELNRIRIYPNPAKSFFYIQDAGKYQGQMVRLFDISGKMYTPKWYEGRIDIAGIPPGVYFVRIKDETGKSASAKVVILR